MQTTSKSIETLNDLIKINNDRVAGFEEAATDLKEDQDDLKSMFHQLAGQSRTNANQLAGYVHGQGAEPESETSVPGAIHRAWIDVKAKLGGDDRKSILAECERGEDAIKKAYRSALKPESDLTTEEKEIVRIQQTGIIASHDRIKAMRDSA
jgi:uncharacterized protein (TIGR02284 family)